MKTFASIVFVMLVTGGATLAHAETWTGKLVDASCKASSEAGNGASCIATEATHLFAIQLPDAKVLLFDAQGNEKASKAFNNSAKTELRATVTGSLEGRTVRVETIDLQ